MSATPDRPDRGHETVRKFESLDDYHKFVVLAVRAHDDLVAALRSVQKLITEAAMTGFNWQDGDWPHRLFESQQVTSAALRKAKIDTALSGVDADGRVG